MPACHDRGKEGAMRYPTVADGLAGLYRTARRTLAGT